MTSSLLSPALSLSPTDRSDFCPTSPTSAGHLHGLGGARRHLPALRALGQGTGAGARPVHGVGGRQGGRAGARQAGHARGSHCGKKKAANSTESCEESSPHGFRLESCAASQHTGLLSCFWRISPARRGFWTTARLCVPKGLSWS